MKFFKFFFLVFLFLGISLISCNEQNDNLLQESDDINYSYLLDDDDFRSTFSRYYKLVTNGGKNFAYNITFEEQEKIQNDINIIENGENISLGIYKKIFGFSTEEELKNTFTELDDEWKKLGEKFPEMKSFSTEEWTTILFEYQDKYQVNLRRYGEEISSDCTFDIYTLGKLGPSRPPLDEWIEEHCPNWDFCSKLFQDRVNVASSEWNNCLIPCAAVGLSITTAFAFYGAQGGSAGGPLGGLAGAVVGGISGIFFGSITSILCANDCYTTYDNKCKEFQTLLRGCCM